MESYVSGIGRGYTKTRSQVIAIAEKTTTTEAATESTTTETSTTTTMTTTTTTAPATTTTTTTLANDIIDKEIEEESQSPEDTLYLDQGRSCKQISWPPGIGGLQGVGLDPGQHDYHPHGVVHVG